MSSNEWGRDVFNIDWTCGLAGAAEELREAEVNTPVFP